MPSMADRSRFHLALPYDQVRSASVKSVGLGNLGSHAAMALCELGIPQFFLIDPDTVGDENVMTQLYDNTHVDWPKVEAMKSILMKTNPHRSGDNELIADAKRIEESAFKDSWAKVTVVTTDNIEARQFVYERALSRAKRGLNDSPQLLVDARMMFDYVEFFFVHPNRDGEREKVYHEGLKERDYVKAGCGASSAGYVGRLAAGIIGSVVRQFLVGRPIPFAIQLDASRFLLEAEWRDKQEWKPEEFAVASVA